ncbi:MAG: tetratricopeptide repeat protein [Vicinamibacterales bacterium]
MTRLLPLAFVVLAFTATAEVRSATQSSDDLARRQYDSGVSFVQNGRYTEALKDFQAVVDSFPQSASADDALLQICLYQLEIAQDQAAAQTAVDKLLKDYPASDSAPMGYVLTGRLTIARSHAAADVEAALASFERASRLFPGSPAVAAARFYAGDALRLARRNDDALLQFRRVALEYPESIWAARASLAAATDLVATDRALQAFGSLQRIRQQFPASAEAAMALNYNTIIYRLYVRKPSAYLFSNRFIGGERDKFRDIVGVAVDKAGRVLLGHKTGVSIFAANGTPSRFVAAVEPTAFFVDGRDQVVVARADMLIPEGSTPTAVVVPVVGKVPRAVEQMPTIITLSSGDRLVSDPKAKTVIRISQAGKFVSNFAAINAKRLARNAFDDVAMIDRDSKSVVIVDRDGKNISRIVAKGTNYVFDDPADVAFDALGHLYVLDSKRAVIHVFGANNRLIATIASTGKEPGSLQKPKALALDAAGRLFVFDEGSQRIQVYQ